MFNKDVTATFMLIIFARANNALNDWLIELRFSCVLIILENTDNCVFWGLFFNISSKKL